MEFFFILNLNKTNYFCYYCFCSCWWYCCWRPLVYFLQFLNFLQARVRELRKNNHSYTTTILLVGIPNVGKSALANSLHQIGRISAAGKDDASLEMNSNFSNILFNFILEEVCCIWLLLSLLYYYYLSFLFYFVLVGFWILSELL